MTAAFSLNEDYWETFSLEEEDIEFLYNYLLEVETPLSARELAEVLVEDRLQREKRAVERQRSEGGEIYLPRESYEAGQKLVFPALSWQGGQVTSVRAGKSYLPESFKVIEVEFEEGGKREFAAELESHILNQPPEVDEDDPLLSPPAVVDKYGQELAERVASGLEENPDFVYIAGRWFPKALLVDVNIGNLNLAEAVLDVANGGPLPTPELLGQVELPEGVNQKLAAFSLDLAMQEDARFDEVGPAGKVLWFLKRQEPAEVQETPLFLRFRPHDYERAALGEEMLALEKALDDELSPQTSPPKDQSDQLQIPLIYPHWRAGTLPLTRRVAQLFPTAYEAPRIRFMLVDGESGERFPGWVVRLEHYVYGLGDWYSEKGVMPGTYVRVRRGEEPGEVIVEVDSSRTSKDWVRTALVGADGGVVYALLKQTVETAYDERMVIAMPSELEALDAAWERMAKDPPPFEQIVVDTLQELAKLNPQSHVHASELYSAVNVVTRSPPGPILALLASRPWFVHVGDLHFRYEAADSQ